MRFKIRRGKKKNKNWNKYIFSFLKMMIQNFNNNKIQSNSSIQTILKGLQQKMNIVKQKLPHLEKKPILLSTNLIISISLANSPIVKAH
jgi:hypothetical protein